MRIVGILLSAATAASAWLALAPSSAFAQSSSSERMEGAQRELRRINRDERFDHAAQRCRSAITDRNEAWASTWCEAASEAAFHAKESEHRRAYTTEESALLLEAAWLIAVNGVQQTPTRSSRPRLRGVSFDDEGDELRVYAYQLLGDIRCDCNPSTSLAVLLSYLDVPADAAEPYALIRERAFNMLLAEPSTSPRLWAAAALAFTLRYQRSGASEEQIRSEASSVAARLAPFVSETQTLTGRDAALYPVLMSAYGDALRWADDLAAAQTVLESATRLCEERIWASADLCLDAGTITAQSRFIATDRQAHPEWANIPMPEPISRQQYAAIVPEGPCTALLVGDIDETGALVDVRILFQAPTNVCEAFALNYANSLSYNPLSALKSPERREDVIVRLRFRPE